MKHPLDKFRDDEPDGDGGQFRCPKCGSYVVPEQVPTPLEQFVDEQSRNEIALGVATALGIEVPPDLVP